jgi:hypothetical protein
MTDDPLAALRDQIRSTAEAADRLAEEARAGTAEPGAPPPRTDEAARETQALVALVEMLRDLLPPELRRQVAELIRQVLMLIRAILDWWVDRLEPGRERAVPAEPAVEDIPLDEIQL